MFLFKSKALNDLNKTTLALLWVLTIGILASIFLAEHFYAQGPELFYLADIIRLIENQQISLNYFLDSTHFRGHPPLFHIIGSFLGYLSSPYDLKYGYWIFTIVMLATCLYYLNQTYDKKIALFLLLLILINSTIYQNLSSLTPDVLFSLIFLIFLLHYQRKNSLSTRLGILLILLREHFLYLVSVIFFYTIKNSNISKKELLKPVILVLLTLAWFYKEKAMHGSYINFFADKYNFIFMYANDINSFFSQYYKNINSYTLLFWKELTLFIVLSIISRSWKIKKEHRYLISIFITSILLVSCIGQYAPRYIAHASTPLILLIGNQLEELRKKRRNFHFFIISSSIATVVAFTTQAKSFHHIKSYGEMSLKAQSTDIYFIEKMIDHNITQKVLVGDRLLPLLYLPNVKYAREGFPRQSFKEIGTAWKTKERAFKAQYMALKLHSPDTHIHKLLFRKQKKYFYEKYKAKIELITSYEHNNWHLFLYRFIYPEVSL